MYSITHLVRHFGFTYVGLVSISLSEGSMPLTYVVACALLGNDSETLCNVARYFMKELQSFTDSYRLFATLNRMYDGPSSFYNSGPSQKYILRQVKAMDLCLIENQQPSASCQERASYTMRDGNGNPVKVEKLDIGLLMLYGYILYAGRSYSFALSKHDNYPFNKCCYASNANYKL